MRALLSLLFVAVLSACSFEPPPEAPDASPPVDAAAPDADTSCETDELEGGALAAHWAMLVGELPTYQVDNSRLQISDAPLAYAASDPTTSWIYELDKDLGNQIGWRQDLGGEDFSVEAELGWASDEGELTLTGIAIADSDGAMAAMIGVNDGSANLTAQLKASVAVANAADLSWYGDRHEIGSATVRIDRIAGNAHLSVDGTEVLSGSAGALISYVTIAYVRHKGASGTVYPFGTTEVRRLTVCR